MKDKEIIEEITEEAVRKNEDNAGAFVDLLNQEMRELQNSMKDKEKQIEEMAKNIEYAICNECKLNNGKSCEDCVFDNKGDWHCQSLMTATHLYGEGYRKLPEDSVVLSREEYEKLKKQLTKARSEKKRFKNKCLALETNKEWDIAQARKETAKEILIKGNQLVKKWLSRNDEKVGFIFDFEEFIKKQFGLEIKE